jgi:glutathione synthase/RimK-type ligase-like ATP-grasp enzyme
VVPLTTVWPDDPAAPIATDSIRLTPAVFQSYVPKAREIRAVVVGERIYAAAVDSQVDEVTRHDVRAADNSDRYEQCQLPAAVAEALARLVAGFGLRSCSADLVETPSGEHVFLELNPNGQWLWLEVHAGLPLSAAVADLLAASVPA